MPKAFYGLKLNTQSHHPDNIPERSQTSEPAAVYLPLSGNLWVCMWLAPPSSRCAPPPSSLQSTAGFSSARSLGKSTGGCGLVALQVQTTRSRPDLQPWCAPAASRWIAGPWSVRRNRPRGGSALPGRDGGRQGCVRRRSGALLSREPRSAQSSPLRGQGAVCFSRATCVNPQFGFYK